MNLAIASPESSNYSETFIKMQMDKLPCVLRIHGEPVASETIPGGPIRWRKSPAGLQDMLSAAVDSGHSPRHTLQVRELKRRLARHRIDAILANYGRTGVALLPICREMSIPLVVHFHGYDAHRVSEVERLRNAYQELGRDCPKIIAVSHAMRDALAELGIPRMKIAVIRCGVDPEAFEARTTIPETPLFFGAGRFVDKKAPYLTVLAFHKVWQHNSKARLVLGGDGPLLETVKNLVAFLGLDAAITLPGVLTPREVARWMGKATAFVQHSVVPRVGPNAGDSEGTPVVVLEALMTGVPVIATRHAGIGEVIQDGATGCLVEERDVEAMAEAMIRLADSPALSERMGSEARRQAIKHHSSSQYLQQLAGLLESIVANNPSNDTENPPKNTEKATPEK